MADSNKKIEKDKFIAKKNESKVKIAERTRKTIYGVFIGVIVLILIFVGLGVGSWIKNEVKPSRTTVISVYDKNISARDYADALAYVSASYPQYAAYFTGTAAQTIELAEVVYRKATELGYSVTDEEVQNLISYYKFDNNQAVRDILRAGLLQNKVRDEYLTPQLDQEVEHRNFQGMFLAAKSEAEDAIQMLNGGYDFAEVVSKYFAETTSTNLHPEGLFDYYFSSDVMDEAIFAAEVGVASMVEDPNRSHSGGYWFVRVDEYAEGRSAATISVIAAPNVDVATEIEQEFAEGKDFDTIATNYSLNSDDETGITQLRVASDSTISYAEFIFDDSRIIGDISGAIYDGSNDFGGGYWVFYVHEAATQKMSESDLSTMASLELNDWSTEIFEAAKDEIKEDLTEVILTWAVKRVTGQ